MISNYRTIVTIKTTKTFNSSVFFQCYLVQCYVFNITQFSSSGNYLVEIEQRRIDWKTRSTIARRAACLMMEVVFIITKFMVQSVQLYFQNIIKKVQCKIKQLKEKCQIFFRYYYL